jgi:uncharacterized membrane protein YhaH (DUF805 family)
MGVVSFLFSFKGRVGRLAYVLGTVGFNLTAYLIVTALMMSVDPQSVMLGQPVNAWLVVCGIISCVLMISTIVSTYALGVKRFHDLNKSGWWMLAGFGAIMAASVIAFAVPLLGFIGMVAACLLSLFLGIQLVFFKGDTGPNDYGNPPTVMKDVFGNDAAGDSEPGWAKSAMSKASAGAENRTPARLAAPAKPAASLPASATTTVTRVARSPKITGNGFGGPAPAGFGRRNR